MSFFGRSKYYVAKYELISGKWQFLDTIGVYETKSQCIDVIMKTINSNDQEILSKLWMFNHCEIKDINYEIKTTFTNL